MSIAVSSVIKPSRQLLAIFSCLCAGIVLITYLIVATQMRSVGIGVQLSIAGVSFALIGFILYHFFQQQQTVRIDISGAGQIRFTRQLDEHDNGRQAHAESSGDLVTLLPDSTLWTHMLILRLINDTGQTNVLIVLPDSLIGDGFRSLSVACRWIAAHNNPDEGTLC